MYDYKYVAHDRLGDRKPVSPEALRLWLAMRVAANAGHNLEHIIATEYGGDRPEVTVQLTHLLTSGWVSAVEGDDWRRNPVKPFERCRVERAAKKEPRGECILSTGSPDKQGYSRVTIRGRTYYAHRLAWEEANGSIPKGASVAHSCGHLNCRNPDHLYLIDKSGKRWKKVWN